MNSKTSNDTENEINNVDTARFELMSLLYQNLPYIDANDISKALDYVSAKNERELLKLICREKSIG